MIVRRKPPAGITEVADSVFTRQDKINLVSAATALLSGMLILTGAVLLFWKDTNVQFATLSLRIENLEKDRDHHPKALAKNGD